MLSMNLKNVNNIAGLLKLWLRLLPDPLIPYSHYDLVIEVNNLTTADEKIEKLKEIVNSLPEVHNKCTNQIMAFLHKITQNVFVNKMSPVNLATVIGPNIMYLNEVDPLKGDYFQQAAMQNAVISLLIQEYPKIFG